MSDSKSSCPDGGTCHHGCTTACWRVKTCGPLSGVYPNDEWPVHIRHANNHRTLLRPAERLYVELAAIFAHLGAHSVPPERWTQGCHQGNGGADVKLADHGVVRVDLARWGLRLKWELPDNVCSVRGELHIESFLSDTWTMKSGVQWGARNVVTASEGLSFGADIMRSANAALHAETMLSWVIAIPSDDARSALLSETAALFAEPGRSFRDAVIAAHKLGGR